MAYETETITDIEIEAISKIVSSVQGQGVPRIESGVTPAVWLVREHFNSQDDAPLKLRSMRNQALRDNAAIGGLPASGG